MHQAVWYLHDGARNVAYGGPDSSPAGQILFAGARMDARNPHAGVSGNRDLLGTARFARNSPAMPGVRHDHWPRRTVRQLRHHRCGGAGSAGTRVFYSDHGDGDGVSNHGEQTMGTDPTDARSYLRLDIADGRERVVLQWPSVEDRTYAIEGTKELGRFEPLKEGIRADPPSNTYEFDRRESSSFGFASKQFWRANRFGGHGPGLTAEGETPGTLLLFPPHVPPSSPPTAL